MCSAVVICSWHFGCGGEGKGNVGGCKLLGSLKIDGWVHWHYLIARSGGKRMERRKYLSRGIVCQFCACGFLCLRAFFSGSSLLAMFPTLTIPPQPMGSVADTGNKLLAATSLE